MHTHACMQHTYAKHTHIHRHIHTQTQHTDIANTVTLTICKIDNNKKNIQYTINPTAPFIIILKILYFIELSYGHRWSVNRVQNSFE